VLKGSKVLKDSSQLPIDQEWYSISKGKVLSLHILEYKHLEIDHERLLETHRQS